MSTDKTLADVQPGGMVRLGDQAERARFEAWAHAQSYRGGNIMADRDAVHPDVYADPIAQLTWKSWKAALSAQPSPGGQGESVTDEMVDAACRAYYDTAEDAVDVDHTCMEAALKAALAALAARQPVRSSTVSEDMMDVVDRLGSEHDEVDSRAWDHMLIYAPTEKLAARLAARQPVGQEPVAYGVINRDGLWMCDFGLATINKESAESFAAWAEEHRTISGPFTVVSLYAAPPAQAVDLGQFRAQVAELLRREFDLEVADPDDHRHDDGAGEADRIAGTIAALIDSQAVGNG